MTYGLCIYWFQWKAGIQDERCQVVHFPLDLISVSYLSVRTPQIHTGVGVARENDWRGGAALAAVSDVRCFCRRCVPRGGIPRPKPDSQWANAVRREYKGVPVTPTDVSVQHLWLTSQSQTGRRCSTKTNRRRKGANFSCLTIGN